MTIREEDTGLGVTSIIVKECQTLATRDDVAKGEQATTETVDRGGFQRVGTHL